MGCVNGKAISEKVIKEQEDTDRESQRLQWIVVPPS